MTPLRSGGDAESLRLRLVSQREHLADTRTIDRDGLFREDVLARGNRGREMNRPEAGRRREDDVVRVSREHLRVCVESGKLAILRHLDLPRVVLADLLQRRGKPTGQGISHRDEPYALRPAE